MRLVLLGPPGAGKGTQAKEISVRLEVPAISTGDIFRSHVSAGTALGREAAAYLDSGRYVPDDVTNAMVRDRLREPDADKGFLLDGYPRTVAQVAELDAMLAEQGDALDAVVELVVAADELVSRLGSRARLEGRSDDADEVARRRLALYTEETAPLAAVYADRGLLRQVDGMGSVEEVTARVLEAIADA
jgi:adenylate kinase